MGMNKLKESFIDFIISKESSLKGEEKIKQVKKGFLCKKLVDKKYIEYHPLISALRNIRITKDKKSFYGTFNVIAIEKEKWDRYEKAFDLAIKYAEPFLLQQKKDELYFLTKCERLKDGRNPCFWTCEVCGCENEQDALFCPECGKEKGVV